MSILGMYVAAHADRGECKCGRCIDRGDKPDPVGHTADLIFFKVVAKNEPNAEALRTLVKQHHGSFNEVDLFDGKEHGYMELGGWIGDQGHALMLMGLGKLLGLWELLTPKSILPPGLPDSMLMEMAQSGLVAIQAAKTGGG